MQATKLMMAAALAVAGVTVVVPTASADCDNYGYVYQVGVGNQYNCMVQHCDQGTGVGIAAASASGTQSGKVGAAGSAGTNCQQSSGGNQTGPPSGEGVSGLVRELLPTQECEPNVPSIGLPDVDGIDDELPSLDELQLPAVPAFGSLAGLLTTQSFAQPKLVVCAES